MNIDNLYEGRYCKWGYINSVHKVAEGILDVSTEGHGGFVLSDECNSQVPDYMRREDGCYEEDCDYAIVVVAFPQHFTPEMVEVAKSSLRIWNPEAFEKHFQTQVKPGESYIRDKEAFEREHVNDYVVISAIGRDDHLVKCEATLGGSRHPGVSRIEVLIKDVDYHERSRFGYVVPTEMLRYSTVVN